ncbi:MAG: M28 family peptidase [Bacteroidales bacterium]
MADELLSSSGKTIEEIENGLNEKREPGSFNTGTLLDATSEINQEMITTRNVIMKLEGNDPALAGEYVIVGGHYDHLGMGGSSSRVPDTVAVHYGADDNASGVASMLG